MGMGFGSNHADCIENKTLIKLFPMEYRALTAALKKTGKTLDELAHYIIDDDIKDDGPEMEALESLADAFAKKYDGLTLHLEFHDQENLGDRYDEVSGAYWSISGLYVLSAGAKQLGEKNFERKFFVTLG